MILSYSTQNSYLSEQRKMLIRCDNKEMLIHCEQQCNQSHYRNRYELSLETKIRGQRVDSVIKSTCCPSRGPGFGSQYPHGSLQLWSKLKGIQVLFQPLWIPGTHLVQTYMQAKYSGR